MMNKIKGFFKKFSLKRKNSDHPEDDSSSEEMNEGITQADHNFLDNDEVEEIEQGPESPDISHVDNHEPGLKEKITGYFKKSKHKLLTSPKEWKIPTSKKDSSGPSFFSRSPNVVKDVDHFFSGKMRPRIHQLSKNALIFSSVFIAGKMTALYFKGPPSLKNARDYKVAIDPSDNFDPTLLNQVRKNNVFKTQGGDAIIRPTTIAKCETASNRSSLPIQLVNTIVLQDEVKSLASVQVRGARDLQEVRIGDEIANLAKISKIERLNIIVRNLESGICEFIASDKQRESSSPISVLSPAKSRAYIQSKKLPGIENSGNNFKISKKLLDEKVKDLAAILTQARAVKIQNPDGTLSFKLTEVDPEGMFPYLGLQNEDIITSINGKPINDLNEVMSLFGKIKNLDQLQLGIKRDGTQNNLDYKIQK